MQSHRFQLSIINGDRPAHLKAISGTERKDRPARSDPVTPEEYLSELPDPPFPMPNEVAANEWKTVGQSLINKGLLCADRLISLATYCALSGKIAQKFAAGDVPSANTLAQHLAFAKRLGLMGASREATDKPAATKGRLAGLKERADRNT